MTWLKKCRGDQKKRQSPERQFRGSESTLTTTYSGQRSNHSFRHDVATKYIGTPATELIGKNIYMVLDMAFPSEDTFDTWLKRVQTSNATARQCLGTIRLNIRDNHPTLLFDLAAYYNRDNSEKIETMMVLSTIPSV